MIVHGVENDSIKELTQSLILINSCEAELFLYKVFEVIINGKTYVIGLRYYEYCNSFSAGVDHSNRYLTYIDYTDSEV